MNFGPELKKQIKTMNIKKLSSYLVIGILSLLISLPAVSQQVLSSIIKKGEIRIGTTGNQPPFSMKSKSGELILPMHWHQTWE